MDNKKQQSDLGDWLFLIIMGGLVIGYYIYDNQPAVADWLSTVKETTAPARVAGSTIADHWGLALLVLALIVAGLWIVGDSLNKQTTMNATTDKLQVHRPYRTVMKRNGAKEIQ